MDSWKAILLNCVGRLCLARSVVNSIFVYLMQNTWVLTGMCEDIDRMAHNFIWLGVGDSREWNIVNWENLNIPRRNGSLGIQDMHLTITTLLAVLDHDS
ncbi:LINE-1 reverse transcriptase isogeny [Sesbania bispinosa]|nr:LINE-1 reverse transcriptase isogeny [Sesbania bispinosa]